MEKEVLRKIMDNKGNSWNIKTKEYMRKTDMTNEILYDMSRTELRKKVREVDKKYWLKEMGNLKTLKMYMNYKSDIKDEAIYDNRISSMWLFRARSNSLKLNQRAYFFKPNHKIEDKICGLCEDEEESLEHFMLICKKLEGKRNNELINRFRGSNIKETLGLLLFETRGEDLELIKEMITYVGDKRNLDLRG